MHFAAAAAADKGGPLTVAEVLALRAKLPKIVRNSPVALLGACRSRLLGDETKATFSKPAQKSFQHALRSVEWQLTGKSAAAAAARAATAITFDFGAKALHLGSRTLPFLT